MVVVSRKWRVFVSVHFDSVVVVVSDGGERVVENLICGWVIEVSDKNCATISYFACSAFIFGIYREKDDVKAVYRASKISAWFIHRLLGTTGVQ